MSKHIINIKQFYHMSLEAVYYVSAADRNTVITITKDTGLGEKGKIYGELALISQTTQNTLERSRIFNIHLSKDQDIKEVEDKLRAAKCICFHSKADNNFHISDETYVYDSSHSNKSPETSLERDQQYSFPEVELTIPATASICSDNEVP